MLSYHLHWRRLTGVDRGVAMIDVRERIYDSVVTQKESHIACFFGCLELYVQRRLCQKIFGEPFDIKETRFTLRLLVQSPFYRGNSGKFFGEYLWLYSNSQRFEI